MVARYAAVMTLAALLFSAALCQGERFRQGHGCQADADPTSVSLLVRAAISVLMCSSGFRAEAAWHSNACYAPLVEGTCPSCGGGLEDEMHLVFECTALQDLQVSFAPLFQ